MTTTPTPAPPASPERPSLVAEACKPDVLVRLRAAAEVFALRRDGVDLALNFDVLAKTAADAITTIQALRDMNQRHCDDERLLKEARARVAELEAERG